MKTFLRYLRIAFSATCLIACVLLIVLWVRSYRSNDSLMVNLLGRNFQAHSILGRLSVATLNRPIGHVLWHIQSRPITPRDSQQEAQAPRFSYTDAPTQPTPEYPFQGRFYGVGMPHWAWLQFLELLLLYVDSFVSLQPPHSANRHDAGCRGAGGHRHNKPLVPSSDAYVPISRPEVVSVACCWQFQPYGVSTTLTTSCR